MALTSRFETSLGDFHPSGRPSHSPPHLFIKIMVISLILFKRTTTQKEKMARVERVEDVRTPKQIILTDVDHCAAERDHPLSPEVIELIRKFSNHDVPFAFISGRNTRYLQATVTEPLLAATPPIFHYILPNNGAVCIAYGPDGLEPIYDAGFTAEERRYIQQVARSFLDENGFSEESAYGQQITNGYGFQVAFLGHNAPRDLKNQFDPEKARRRAWSTQLQQRFATQSLRGNIEPGGSSTIDITPHDKGTAAKYLSEQLHTSLDGIVYFGDDPEGNDSSVIPVVDFIAVDNPRDMYVKAQQLYHHLFP